MNEQRIKRLVDDIFYDIVETDKVREQKEELRIHLTERVRDYMTDGADFDEALKAAKLDLGDTDELTAEFERKRMVEFDDFDDGYGVQVQLRLSHIAAKLTPLAPFIYIILGLTQHLWQPSWWTWGWWAWGWVIIPVIPILSSGFHLGTLVPLSPFIYMTLGFIIGGSWWAWGWMIIPMSAIMFSGGKKKRKKKKKKIRVGVNHDFMNEVGKNMPEVRVVLEKVADVVESIAEEVEETTDTSRNN